MEMAGKETPQSPQRGKKTFAGRPTRPAASGPSSRSQRKKWQPVVHEPAESSLELKQGDNTDMAKKEQKPNKPSDAAIARFADYNGEPKDKPTALLVDDQQQGMNLLAGLQKALTDISKTLEAMGKAIISNTRDIEILAAKPPEKQQSLIPPEILDLVVKAIPDVLKAFTATPLEETAAAARGAFTDAMRDAMEKSFIANQDISTKILQANLDQVMLNNQTMAKRLTEAF